MLNTSDKKYIKRIIQRVQVPLEKKMVSLDKKYDRKTKQLDDKIEDLRNDMADQFLINNQEHHTILQELKEFKNKSYEFFDQILGELKAMRENYTICFHRRHENGERLDLLEPRVKTMEGHLLLTAVTKG